MADSHQVDNRPNWTSTGCWIIGLAFTYLFLTGDTPEELGRHAAIGVGATMIVGIGIEGMKNWRSLLRPDALAFLALYFLTFFEFLSRQPEVNQMIGKTAIHHACWLALLAFGSMAIARHLAPAPPGFLTSIVRQPIPARMLFLVFALCFFFGIFYMLLAVNFNVIEMIDQMMGPRFTQSWGRGRYGDWKALLNQVGDIITLVPPLGGLILARRERYNPFSILVVLLGVIFCLFQAVAGGTRNVLATYIITFLVGYGLNTSRKRWLEFGVLGCVAAIGFLAASPVMLSTRTIGLKEYLTTMMATNQRTPSIVLPDDDTSFFVDLDLVNIGQLTTVFPSLHGFLGLEVPYLAVVAPVPRAIWVDKPAGLSLSMENALGVGEEMTLSATFIGEAYMAGGAFGVIVAGFFFGMLTGWWGRLAGFVTSEFGFLIYASGFLAIAISMRSLYVLTPTALPTIGAICITLIFSRIARGPEAELRVALPTKQ